MNGKGSSPRPRSVSYDKFSDNWDRIFGTKQKIIKCHICDLEVELTENINFCERCKSMYALRDGEIVFYPGVKKEKDA